MTANHSPLFTIAMPAYRARETIATAIASVLAQTESRFELIVVDDGSPDDSATIAALAAGNDPRVRILRQANAGPSVARNLAVRHGTAPLVAFLDADDRWAPDLLARHAAHLQADATVGISFGRVRFYDPAMAVGGRVSAHVAMLSLAQAIGENPVCTTSNLVVRRDVFEEVGGFDTGMKHAEDHEWIARVLATTNWEARGIDTVLVDYRTSVGGLSADPTSMRVGWQAMIERIRARAPEKVAASEAVATALFERYLARRALRTGQPATTALRDLTTAARRSPMALLRHGPKRTLLTAAGLLLAILFPPELPRSGATR
jgi:glycosyltransferase involved in cell wall biosynthesis